MMPDDIYCIMNSHWLLVLFLLGTTYCLTTLSSNNCPKDFNINNDNSTISGSSLSSFIYQNLYSPAD